jgi:uncharacterized integral membrane protein (TIGR00698 family)
MDLNFIKEDYKGIILCVIISFIATKLGHIFPIIGATVIGIVIGMFLHFLIIKHSNFQSGIKFTSKKILQYAVIFLGFGLNLSVVLKTGKQSFPIIISTISTSLLVAYILHKVMKISKNSFILVGVGSSICGGSAIAATAPIINADDAEIAQSMSVIFFFNVIAALIFPFLGIFLGFPINNGEAFGIFAGTAVNDTSSVTAAASTWDSLYNLGTSTLDKAVTVKLTRTLAIIPITMFLAFLQTKKAENKKQSNPSLIKGFPFFILFFILASVITTISLRFGISNDFFIPFKNLSKFMIVMAMTAIGLNTNIIKLVKTGGKPLFLGFFCWISITIVALVIQGFLF